MSTTSDLTALITKIYPRASSISADQAAAIFDVVADEIQEDLFTVFDDTFTDSVVFTLSQISEPSAALAGSGAGNVDDGKYRYRISYTNAKGETMAGTPSDVLAVADNTSDGQVSLTSVPVSSDTDVSQRNVYRQQNGTGDYNLVGTISDNTTTTFTDNVAQASLTTKALDGIVLPADFYRQKALLPKWVDERDTGPRIPIIKKKSLSSSSTRNYAYIDYTDRASGTAQACLCFDPQHNFQEELTFLYRVEIADATSSGDLPFPTEIQGRLLPLLAYGVSFYYLASKTGEDDHVTKLAQLYQTAKDNLLGGGGIGGLSY